MLCSQGFFATFLDPDSAKVLVTHVLTTPTIQLDLRYAAHFVTQISISGWWKNRCESTETVAGYWGTKYRIIAASLVNFNEYRSVGEDSFILVPGLWFMWRQNFVHVCWRCDALQSRIFCDLGSCHPAGSALCRTFCCSNIHLGLMKKSLWKHHS